MLPRDVLECLAHNLDPATGKVLRPHAKDGDRVGMDFTFNAPKSVTLARELSGQTNEGDPRVEAAHREAVAYAMGHIEADMKTRVRVGGADHDRATGNLCAYRVTHRDTRINADDQLPDPHLHDHVFVMNLTFDPVEEKFKAAQIGQIKHDAPYYEALYMNRLASNLRELGYGVRRKDKAFEISGVSDELVKKFSRRSEYIKSVAAKLGITNPKSKDKLGATTRLGKAKEPADDLNGYYVSRLTQEERTQLGSLEGKPSYVSSDREGVSYAIGHLFERQSVIEERKLYETAIRHGIGSVTPEGIEAEAKRQGMLLKDGQATTRGVLAEESRIIDFAREGKGTMRPLVAQHNTQAELGAPLKLGREEKPLTLTSSATVPHRALGSDVGENSATSVALSQQKGRPEESKRPPMQPGLNNHLATLYPQQQAVSKDHIAEVSKKVGLSPQQQAIVDHILQSPDRMILVIGDAGTGKTTAIKSAFQQIDRPIEMLAPSADASRGVLREAGFSKADTVASFLMDQKRQAGIKNGVIWVDEAGLLPIRDLSRLTEIATQQNARIVLQGDPKQHHAVVRHGNMMNVLQEYAGLPVGRLTEIWRQNHKGYKAIVAEIADGKQSGAFDKLAALGWVKKVDGNSALVADYIDALQSKKAGQQDKDRVMIVAPTHVEGDEITGEIRTKLKESGVVDKDERTFKTLRQLAWTPAEKADPLRYEGTETLQFHRNSGPFRAGERVRIADWRPGVKIPPPEHFSVYQLDERGFAGGDHIRITATGKDKSGRHKLNNGSHYTVAGFTPKGDIALTNGWVLDAGFGHIGHGYVSTSYASQGKSVDRVLIAMGSESRGAINAEQFYVSVSRGKESAKVYTDMAAEELKQTIQRTDQRKSATELLKPKKKPQNRRRKFLTRIKDYYDQLRERIGNAMTERKEQERGLSHER